MTPVLDIIVVNWNAGKQLGVCMRSVLAADRPAFRFGRVVVVDNGSTDGSADGIEALAAPVVAIRNPDNCGFAGACNQGASGSHADYLLFLNPDTRLFPDSLVKPIEFLERPENTSVGIVGIQLLNDGGTVHRSCARFPTAGRYPAMMLGLDRLTPRLFPPHFMVEWDHSDTRPVDQVTGAFFLVRRSLFDRLTGFDERFFLYFEDVDLCFAAQDRGWELRLAPAARVAHHHSATLGDSPQRAYYLARNQVRLVLDLRHPISAHQVDWG